MKLVVRPYRESDLEGVCILDDACFSDAFRVPRSTMQSYLRRRGTIALVAETPEGDLVGLVIVHLEGSGKTLRGYVVTLDVQKSFRRQGLAGDLMAMAERMAQSHGALWMGLHVYTENHDAVAFYEASGFVGGARIPGFYGAEGMDAWIFRKSLGKAE